MTFTECTKDHQCDDCGKCVDACVCVDRDEYPTALHAHVFTESRDCDSTYSNAYVMTFSDEELAESAAAQGINDFSEIHFRQRVLSYVVSAYTCVSGSLSVMGDAETGLTERLSWTESTEEGYRRVEATFCTDDCDSEANSYRDSTAEAMGY